MRIASRSAVTGFVVVLWILAGPLAAAFGACAAMGMMCEGPCGAANCSLLPAPTGALPLFAMLAVPEAHHPPRVLLSIPELPPESTLLFL